ncbi:hypothetical protein HY967_02685, partial [Candidatus Jorgensenbacteria bacterium]|nr:hypothetical protein [Candidatus Jorgensenbacteria bacterium]
MGYTLNVWSKSTDWRARYLSNFAADPFELEGEGFASVEGFIQGIKYPLDDPRREQAFNSVGKEAKR